MRLRVCMERPCSRAEGPEDHRRKGEEGGHLGRGLHACECVSRPPCELAVHADSCSGEARAHLSISLPEQPRGPQVVSRSQQHAALDQARERVHGASAWQSATSVARWRRRRLRAQSGGCRRLYSKPRSNAKGWSSRVWGLPLKGPRSAAQSISDEWRWCWRSGCSPGCRVDASPSDPNSTLSCQIRPHALPLAAQWRHAHPRSSISTSLASLVAAGSISSAAWSSMGAHPDLGLSDQRCAMRQWGELRSRRDRSRA